jgi:ankyrin repeat protein
MLAAEAGNEALVKFLLAKEANAAIKDGEDKSVKEYASESENSAVIKLLQ